MECTVNVDLSHIKPKQDRYSEQTHPERSKGHQIINMYLCIMYSSFLFMVKL